MAITWDGIVYIHISLRRDGLSLYGIVHSPGGMVYPFMGLFIPLAGFPVYPFMGLFIPLAGWFIPVVECFIFVAGWFTPICGLFVLCCRDSLCLSHDSGTVYSYSMVQWFISVVERFISVFGWFITLLGWFIAEAGWFILTVIVYFYGVMVCGSIVYTCNWMLMPVVRWFIPLLGIPVMGRFTPVVGRSLVMGLFILMVG
jgi:hypothetical protein